MIKLSVFSHYEKVPCLGGNVSRKDKIMFYWRAAILVVANINCLPNCEGFDAITK